MKKEDKRKIIFGGSKGSKSARDIAKDLFSKSDEILSEDDFNYNPFSEPGIWRPQSSREFQDYLNTAKHHFEDYGDYVNVDPYITKTPEDLPSLDKFTGGLKHSKGTASGPSEEKRKLARKKRKKKK